MIVTYDVYKRGADGMRSELIDNYDSLSITLNWSKRSKFTIKAKNQRICPFDIGDYVVIYRNSELIFDGLVQTLSVESKGDSDTISWNVSGEDDSVVFDWRIILTDFNQNKELKDLTFDTNTYDKCEAKTAYERMLHYIENCFGNGRYGYGIGTKEERQIKGLILPFYSSVDEKLRKEWEDAWDKATEKPVAAYRLKRLSEVLNEIGKEDKLYPKYTWTASPTAYSTAITKEVQINPQRDISGSVVISPQFGNIDSWSLTKKYPKFNAVWVCSGEYTEVVESENENEENKEYQKRVWVYAEDKSSIKKYGRIESSITKSDIKITDDDESTEDVDETLTEEDVIKLLKDVANKELKDNAATEKYTIKITETENTRFMTDWKLGDKVKVILPSEVTGEPKALYSTIESVSLTYSGLDEKVKPTIGAVEEGMFGDIFDMISGIDRRLRNEEEK